MLKQIFKLQKTFEKNYINLDNNNIKYKREMTQVTLLAMITEIVELLNEIKWKNLVWKYKDEEVDIKKLKLEIIDIFIYFINICLIWDIDAKDLKQLYMIKNKQNKSKLKSNKKGEK